MGLRIEDVRAATLAVGRATVSTAGATQLPYTVQGCAATAFVTDASQRRLYSILTRFNQIPTLRSNSRWQVDKESIWFVESPTYLSQFIQSLFITIYLFCLLPAFLKRRFSREPAQIL